MQRGELWGEESKTLGSDAMHQEFLDSPVSRRALLQSIPAITLACAPTGIAPARRVRLVKNGRVLRSRTEMKLHNLEKSQRTNAKKRSLCWKQIRKCVS
jgi:hypothetical protein